MLYFRFTCKTIPAGYARIKNADLDSSFTSIDSFKSSYQCIVFSNMLTIYYRLQLIEFVGNIYLRVYITVTIWGEIGDHRISMS